MNKTLSYIASMAQFSHPQAKLVLSLLIGKYSTMLWGPAYACGAAYHCSQGNTVPGLTMLGMATYQGGYFLALQWLGNHPQAIKEIQEAVGTIWQNRKFTAFQ